MRSSRPLDTAAASLYVWLAGRAGLLRATLDRVAAMIALEAPDPSRRRSQLHSLLQCMPQKSPTTDRRQARPGDWQTAIKPCPALQDLVPF